MPIRGFKNENVVACFTEPSSTGAVFDINAPRNAPAKNPGSYLSMVQWHVDFFQYELAAPVQTVTISHPALSGQLKYWGPSNQYWIFDATYTSSISYGVPGQTTTTEHVLYTHSLGYVPLAFVAYNGRMLMPGVVVQVESEGRTRFVSAYVTTSAVMLREVYSSTSDALPAVTRSYQVMVFRVPVVEAHRKLFSKDGSNVVIGRGKINTSKHYLRRVGVGDTPFNIDRGPTIDINSGRSRIVTGGSTTTEGGYGGSFSGPTYVPVGV